MSYTIHTPAGVVAGFSQTHQCVQVAGLPEYIKVFKTRALAQKFIDRYADLGYGLERKSAVILPYSK